MQYLLEDSSLKEEPSVRLYQRSDWGAVLGSSLELLAMAKTESQGEEGKKSESPNKGKSYYIAGGLLVLLEPSPER